MTHSQKLENALTNDRTGLDFDPKVTGSHARRMVLKVQLSVQQTFNREPTDTIVTL